MINCAALALPGAMRDEQLAMIGVSSSEEEPA